MTTAATPGRRLWHLAWPLTLANLSVPLVGLVDTAVLGHLPDPALLGGVALAGVVFSVLYWGFGFLRMGTTALAAQALGRRDGPEAHAVLLRALATAALLGTLLILLADPIGRLAWHLLQSEPAVLDAAQHYYAIRIWSAPATLANYVLLGWLLGLQRRHAPLALLLTLNLGNALLDLILVWGLGWGVAGAAWAALAAEYLTLALGWDLVRRALKTHHGLTPHPRGARLWHPQALARLWRINGDLFLRTLLLIFALGFFTAQSARLDPILLAANAVLLNFQTLLAYALDGLAQAIEALVGEATGAESDDQRDALIRSATIHSGLIGLAFSLGYALGGETVIALLTDQPGVRQAAHDYLPWVIVSPLIAVWSYLLDGIFLGAGRTRELRNAMAVAVFLVYLPAWALTRGWGNHGLWFALIAFLAARALLLAWRWHR